MDRVISNLSLQKRAEWIAEYIIKRTYMYL